MKDKSLNDFIPLMERLQLLGIHQVVITLWDKTFAWEPLTHQFRLVAEVIADSLKSTSVSFDLSHSSTVRKHLHEIYSDHASQGSTCGIFGKYTLSSWDLSSPIDTFTYEATVDPSTVFANATHSQRLYTELETVVSQYERYSDIDLGYW